MEIHQQLIKQLSASNFTLIKLLISNSDNPNTISTTQKSNWLVITPSPNSPNFAVSPSASFHQKVVAERVPPNRSVTSPNSKYLNHKHLQPRIILKQNFKRSHVQLQIQLAVYRQMNIQTLSERRTLQLKNQQHQLSQLQANLRKYFNFSTNFLLSFYIRHTFNKFHLRQQAIRVVVILFLLVHENNSFLFRLRRTEIFKFKNYGITNVNMREFGYLEPYVSREK